MGVPRDAVGSACRRVDRAGCDSGLRGRGCSSDGDARKDGGSDKTRRSTGRRRDGRRTDVGGDDAPASDAATPGGRRADTDGRRHRTDGHQVPGGGDRRQRPPPTNLTATVPRSAGRRRSTSRGRRRRRQRPDGRRVRGARREGADHGRELRQPRRSRRTSLTPRRRPRPVRPTESTSGTCTSRTTTTLRSPAVDAMSNRVPIAATTVAVAGDLQRDSRSPEPTGRRSSSGTSSMPATPTANGISDLLVGSFTGKRAYLYLEQHERARDHGQRDVHRRRDDHRLVRTRGRVHRRHRRRRHGGHRRSPIAERRRTSTSTRAGRPGRRRWPTPTPTTSSPSTPRYDGSIFGASMARLGDFNGDGVDDFAIGATLFGGAAMPGRVVVVFGKVGLRELRPAERDEHDRHRRRSGGHDAAVRLPRRRPRTLLRRHRAPRWSRRRPGTPPAASGNEGRLYAFHGADRHVGRDLQRHRQSRRRRARRATIASASRSRTSGRWSTRCRRSAAAIPSNA